MLALYIFLLSFLGAMCYGMNDIDPVLKAWNKEIICKMLIDGHKDAGKIGADVKVKDWMRYRKECDELASEGKFEELQSKIMTKQSVYNCVQETAEKIKQERAAQSLPISNRKNTKPKNSCIIS